MRFSPHGKRDRRLIVELTSMVDIVFLLIIFFMVTSDFARDARAEVDLPRLQGEQSGDSEEAGLFINIDASGNIILSTSESPVTIEQLRARLAVMARVDRPNDPSGGNVDAVLLAPVPQLPREELDSDDSEDGKGEGAEPEDVQQGWHRV